MRTDEDVSARTPVHSSSNSNTLIDRDFLTDLCGMGEDESVFILQDLSTLGFIRCLFHADGISSPLMTRTLDYQSSQLKSRESFPLILECLSLMEQTISHESLVPVQQNSWHLTRLDSHLRTRAC